MCSGVPREASNCDLMTRRKLRSQYTLTRSHGSGPSLSTYAEALWRCERTDEMGTLVSLSDFLFDTDRADEAVGVLEDCHRLMLELADPRADEFEGRLRTAQAAADAAPAADRGKVSEG